MTCSKCGMTWSGIGCTQVTCPWCEQDEEKAILKAEVERLRAELEELESYPICRHCGKPMGG